MLGYEELCTMGLSVRTCFPVATAFFKTSRRRWGGLQDQQPIAPLPVSSTSICHHIKVC